MSKSLDLFAMIVATVLVGLFCASFIKDMNDPNYDIPTAFYPVLAVVVGAVFGIQIKRSSNGS